MLTVGGIATTDKERFGGYAARSRNAGPTTVTFGDYSTFNFTGRDGFLLVFMLIVIVALSPTRTVEPSGKLIPSPIAERLRKLYFW